ncbi:hypothetical protein SAMN04488511_1169 [Pedobacter suwonensis]|uniref:Uncharacterized protein n=1 Tax=Pedobacter suwonensis TaxID=332999 RepID=A0A1I0TXA5_9SPHI|nr:hypothetical protein [Pedobacter suwonensis]SFA56461.1 hypothetical protein SAMN04488511_1169 [Pedobacter suwonensis]
MNIENFEHLKEQLWKKGFGESLNGQLEAELNSGKPEFTLEHSVKVKDDEVAYRLHFRRDNDPQKDKVYFNSYDAMLFKSDQLREGEVRQHNFPAEKRISAAEAYRMLKFGDLVSVNKNLYNKEGQLYNTWLTLDIKGPKDEYGNYPVNSYHENYYKKHPFDLGEVLKSVAIPVKELESISGREDIALSLRKAHLVPVTIMHNSAEQKGFLSVDPKAGSVTVLDQKMQHLDVEAPSKAQQEARAKEQQQEKQEDEKKRPPRSRG